MATEVKEFTIKKFQTSLVTMRVIGKTALIQNRFSKEKIERMKDKEEGKSTGERPPRDPEAEYRGSLHINSETGNYCHPAKGFHDCIVQACRQVSGLTMVGVKGAFSMCTDFVDLEDCQGGYWRPGVKEPKMREDWGHIPPGPTGKGAMIYGGEYFPWAATFTIEYNPNAITIEQLAYLLELGGFCTGVGRWRPGSKNPGTHGRFHLETKEDENSHV